MRRRSISIPHRPGERGVALVLTLSILALVTLLLIAFVGSMRVENAASKNFNEVIKARELAQAGVDEAVGAIRLAAPIIGPLPNGSNYVTAPGMIYTSAAGGAWVAHPLYTSVNPIDPPNPSLLARVVDLNTNYVITGQGTLYTVGNVPLYAGWSNIVITNAAAPNGQLVGRYAYWVDDESAKVNLNAAGTRGNDPSGFTPAAIDLQTLFGVANQFAITNYASQIRPFDTIESLKMQPSQIPSAPGISDTLYLNNQFFVTSHSTSPDLTPWGAKRLSLSDIAATLTNPTPALKQAAVGTIAAALSDPNLAAWFGQNFASKYNPQQIAANIVDYISTDNNPTDQSTSSSDTSQPPYLGLKETPYLNQLAIANTFTITPTPPQPPSTPGTLAISTSISAQLWYMYTNSAGWTASPANKPWVYVMNVPSITLQGGPVQYVTFNSATITTAGPTGIKSMTPPSSQLVSITSQQSFALTDVNAPILVTQNPGSFTAIFSSPQGRMDWAQATVPLTKSKSPLTSGSSLTSAFQATDPRVKPSLSGNWSSIQPAQLNSPSPPTPTASSLSAGNGTLSGDGDMSCHVFSANPGTTGRQRGQMYPSELAYIHTGVPWRTLFLERQPTAEYGSVPDWLAVDLFSTTDITNVTGRMNVNTPIYNANTAVGGSTLPDRVAPLEALLSGNPSVANNIYDYSVHNTPNVATFVPAGDKFFTTAGQVCEVTGLADGPGQKSVREAPAQAIVNLVTPRSNTFTIWCLAQSVKKVDKTVANLGYFTPGADVVTGEAKVQAIVERTVDISSGTPQVKFRTLYYRYLNQ